MTCICVDRSSAGICPAEGQFLSAQLPDSCLVPWRGTSNLTRAVAKHKNFKRVVNDDTNEMNSGRIELATCPPKLAAVDDTDQKSDAVMSDTPLVLQPLVPVPAGSYSWLDLLVVPLCLLCSITLHICFAPPEHVLHRHQAFLYRMSTSHARFLPKESQHAFKYSTLNLGVDLDALEQGLLDVGSRWFAFNQRRWTLFAFHSDMFSSLPTSREEQDRPAARVRKHLQERGVPPHHASKIFTVAMPAYAGFAGINPLVVHYCYATSEKSHLALQVVVLEVHNTFEERHIYVLRVGQDQDERRSPG